MLPRKRALVAVAWVGVSWACTARARLVRQDETTIMRDLRTLREAEAAYRSRNFGYYDVPECLATPAMCIPWYQATGPALGPSSQQLLAKKNGYVRHFMAGRAPERPMLPPDASGSSILEWAYTAVPERSGDHRRAFCVDSTDRICRYPRGTRLRLKRAQCPSPCERVE
jgi:hypothetical protein